MGWDGPITHRQFICWNEWLDFIAINQTSRDNYYQMQVACEQRRSISKNPRSVKLDHFKLRFNKKVVSSISSSQDEQDEGGVKKPPKTPQQIKAEYAKQVWISRMTKPITVRQDGQVIDTIEPPAVKSKRIREEALAKARENAIDKKQQQKKHPLKSPPDSTTDDKPDGINKRRSIRPTSGRRDKVRPDVRRGNKEDVSGG